MAFDYDSYIFQQPEEEWSGEETYIDISLEHERVFIEDSGIEFLDADLIQDYVDPDTYEFVMDAQELFEQIQETLANETPQVDGYYLLSGWIHIPYIIWRHDYPERPKPKNRYLYEHPEDDDEVEIEIKGTPTCGDLKWEYIEEDDVLEEI